MNAAALPNTMSVRQVFAGPTMGTRWSLVAYVPPDLDRGELHAALQSAVDRVDAQMSTYKPESDLMRFNRAPLDQWIDLPDDLMEVLALGLEIGRRSGGAFDIGMGAAVTAWGFGPPAETTGAPQPLSIVRPTHEVLELDLEGGRARKTASLNLDLSGIAKGYGVDALAGIAHAAGLTQFLASIDGELVGRGGKPDGTAWQVALEKPVPGLREAEGIIELRDGAIATSGDYRHFREIDGRLVSHTIDPRTGAPLRDGPASVTVRAATCAEADAWATAFMVLGEAASTELALREGVDVLVRYR